MSEAAREIARATSVHPTDSTATLGQSAETQSVVAVQRALVPSLGTPTFVCNDITGAASSHVPCTSGDYVKVTVSATYRPISPLAFLGQITLSSSSSIEIP